MDYIMYLRVNESNEFHHEFEPSKTARIQLGGDHLGITFPVLRALVQQVRASSVLPEFWPCCLLFRGPRVVDSQVLCSVPSCPLLSHWQR